jgi:hypothetical protein
MRINENAVIEWLGVIGVILICIIVPVTFQFQSDKMEREASHVDTIGEVVEIKELPNDIFYSYEIAFKVDDTIQRIKFTEDFYLLNRDDIVIGKCAILDTYIYNEHPIKYELKSFTSCP